LPAEILSGLRKPFQTIILLLRARWGFKHHLLLTVQDLFRIFGVSFPSSVFFFPESFFFLNRFRVRDSRYTAEPGPPQLFLCFSFLEYSPSFVLSSCRCTPLFLRELLRKKLHLVVFGILALLPRLERISPRTSSQFLPLSIPPLDPETLSFAGVLFYTGDFERRKYFRNHLLCFPILILSASFCSPTSPTPRRYVPCLENPTPFSASAPLRPLFLLSVVVPLICFSPLSNFHGSDGA